VPELIVHPLPVKYVTALYEHRDYDDDMISDGTSESSTVAEVNFQETGLTSCFDHGVQEAELSRRHHRPADPQTTQDVADMKRIYPVGSSAHDGSK